MKGSAKQIAYAEALKKQFIDPRQEAIDNHIHCIEICREKMAADPSRDYSERIACRTRKIERLQNAIDAVNKIDDAGELISAIIYRRGSLFFAY